jgi:hypothetical protein
MAAVDGIFRAAVGRVALGKLLVDRRAYPGKRSAGMERLRREAVGVRDDLRRYILEHFAAPDVNCLPSMYSVRARLSELTVWATFLRVLHISLLIGSSTMHYVLPELNDCTC